MRDRIAKCALVLATCLPSLAFAQRAPASAPQREGSFELSIGAGGMYLDHQLGLLIQRGLFVDKVDTAVGKIFPAGLAQVAYHFNRQFSLAIGSGVAYGSSTLILQPFGALSWTPDVDARTSPFVTLGAGVTSIRWRSYRATAKYGAHVGAGVRHSLGDRLALRVEGLVQVESYSDSAAPKIVNNAIASIGLSWFVGGRRAAVATIAMRPASVSFDAVGDSRQLAATPRDARGRALAGRLITWTTSDGSVAQVSGTGLVTARGAGTATITAASEARSGTASVTVAPAVATLAVSPASGSLTSLRQTLQLVASAQDRNGNAIPGPQVTWTSSDPSVATVGASGVVTAAKNGTATITAAANGQTAMATVGVAQTPTSVAVTPATASLTAIGGTAQLTAQVLDAGGNAVAGAPVTWTSDAPAVATVSPTGLVTAVGNGTAHLSAAARNLKGTATLTVASARAAAPAPAPAPAAVAAVLPPTVGASVVLHNVNFRPNSYRLPLEATAQLDTLAAAMQSLPSAVWEIGGYTSSMGTAPRNLRLSRLRALAVRNYLVRHGVLLSHLRAVGYGPANPVASNATVAGRRQNMRVEIKRLR